MMDKMDKMSDERGVEKVRPEHGDALLPRELRLGLKGVSVQAWLRPRSVKWSYSHKAHARLAQKERTAPL